MLRHVLVALVALVVLAGCGSQSSISTASEGASEAPVAAPAERMDAAGGTAGEASYPAGGSVGDPADGSVENTPNPSAPQNTAAQFGRMVIRTATLSLLVENADDAEARVRSIAQALDGYVLSSQTSGDEDHRSVMLTFKVPVAQFDQALAEVEEVATRVQSRNVTGEDVTDQFVDIESRLRNLRATEARLLEFLKAARNTEEALQVNQQLTSLQGEIEQASGRRQLLQQSTAFSTITVNLQPNVAIAFSSDASWSPLTVARASFRNLVAFGQGIADIVIALLVWSPVWGVLLLAGFAVYRRFGRRPAVAEPPSTPQTPQTT